MNENRIDRRRLFGVGVGVAAVAAGAGTALAASSAGAAPSARPSRVALRWWGNNGWEIRLPNADGTATKTVLIDPWLTRFPTGTYSEDGADPNTQITVDTALLDTYLDSGELRADHILVTHGHYDHLPDIPYLARKTGATVYGTETHVNLMLALGAPAEQLAVVSGGEYLRFDGYTIRVVPSLHSAVGQRAAIPFPGTRPGAVPSTPTVISDLVEGGTLAYQVAGDGLAVLCLGGSNYIESELTGLRPDVLLMPAGGGSVHDYAGRMLRALDSPRHVLPTHWDDFDEPLTEPARDAGGLMPLRQAVAAASPASTFTVLDHLEIWRP